MRLTGAKRSVNLSLNAALVARARRITDNLSAEVETLLADFVAKNEALHNAEGEQLRRTATAWDDFTARHGSLADEFSPL
ncbi:MAG: type II toxin-antitoxin system CcdA family antitoxin [Labilithrix sp.]|nr:type II toxin-antitoxin system CcdA family antitoxin [Labilithrix sp.]MCW5811320.1 type II toxin-antitoxin system CcdA family antitoxin [Labilithrix sp.]